MSEKFGLDSEIKTYEFNIICNKCGFSIPSMPIKDTNPKNAKTNAIYTFMTIHYCPHGPLEIKDVSAT